METATHEHSVPLDTRMTKDELRAHVGESTYQAGVRIAERVEAQSARLMARTIPGSAATPTGLVRLGDGQPSELGSRDPQVCRDCGAAVQPERLQVTRWLTQWVLPPHRCPEKAAREARERQERAARLQAALENTEAALVDYVNQRASIPHFVRGGLEWVRREFGTCAALDAATDIREQILAGVWPAKGVLIIGCTGTGKTTLSGALAHDIEHVAGLRQGAVVFCSLAADIESYYSQIRSPERSADYQRWQERLRTAQVLVLDDVGAVAYTERVCHHLFHLLDTIYRGVDGPRRRVLIATSDLTPPALAARMTAVAPQTADRIVRRLAFELCDVVRMERD